MFRERFWLSRGLAAGLASTAVAIAFAAWLARRPQRAEDATTWARSAIRRADAASRSHARANIVRPADAGR